jgi:hypothetical protein
MHKLRALSNTNNNKLAGLLQISTTLRNNFI